MKKAIQILILVISFVSCIDKPIGYEIHGQISGVENEKVVLWDYKYDCGWTVVDSTRVLNNEFMFQGIVGMPKPYYLTISGVKGDAPIIVENNSISVVIDKNELEGIQVKGSELHQQYVDYLEYRNSNFDQKIDDLKNSKHSADHAIDSILIDSINQQIDLLNTKMIDHLKSYARENSSSIVVPFIASNPPERYLLSDNDLEEILACFDSSIKESNYVKDLQSWRNGIINKTIGSPITNLIMNDTSGNPISTNILRGKYWLLDFWSSKCGPCRKGHPELKEIYQKFKNNGFEIYAVSFDSKRKEWIDAINKDNIDWIQVCELNGWNNKAKILYSIEYLPQNLLVNPDGIIIASGLNGESLAKRLNDIYN